MENRYFLDKEVQFSLFLPCNICVILRNLKFSKELLILNDLVNKTCISLLTLEETTVDFSEFSAFLLLCLDHIEKVFYLSEECERAKTTEWL